MFFVVVVVVFEMAWFAPRSCFMVREKKSIRFFVINNIIIIIIIIINIDNMVFLFFRLDDARDY